MPDSYIILKFGKHRVLLQNRAGESATMTRPVDGGYVIFDYSGCDVVGSVVVQDHEPEPTPTDIIAGTRQFHAECNEKIASALLSAGCERDFTVIVNSCPAHGTVDRDHRCPQFDRILRDAWTGEIIPESDSPADNVKYLGMTEDGSQYAP